MWMVTDVSTFISATGGRSVPGNLDVRIRRAGSIATLASGGFRTSPIDAGPQGPACAMGVATGDYDGDGRVDLFVTGWRDQKLYRTWRGRFDDRTEAAGLSSVSGPPGRVRRPRR